MRVGERESPAVVELRPRGRRLRHRRASGSGGRCARWRDRARGAREAGSGAVGSPTCGPPRATRRGSQVRRGFARGRRRSCRRAPRCSTTTPRDSNGRGRECCRRGSTSIDRSRSQRAQNERIYSNNTEQKNESCDESQESDDRGRRRRLRRIRRAAATTATAITTRRIARTTVAMNARPSATTPNSDAATKKMATRTRESTACFSTMRFEIELDTAPVVTRYTRR